MLLDRDSYLLNNLSSVNVEVNTRWPFIKIISDEHIWRQVMLSGMKLYSSGFQTCFAHAMRNLALNI